MQCLHTTETIELNLSPARRVVKKNIRRLNDQIIVILLTALKKILQAASWSHYGLMYCTPLVLMQCQQAFILEGRGLFVAVVPGVVKSRYTQVLSAFCFLF